MAKRKQETDQIEAWIDTQQALWSGWQEMLGKSATPSAGELWEKGIGTWRKSVENTIAAQLDAARSWRQGLGELEGMSPEARTWADEGVRMVEQWGEVQRKLLEQWLEFLRESGVGMIPQAGKAQPEKLAQAWEEMAKKMVQMQTDWASSWSKQAK